MNNIVTQATAAPRARVRARRERPANEGMGGGVPPSHLPPVRVQRVEVRVVLPPGGGSGLGGSRRVFRLSLAVSLSAAAAAELRAACQGPRGGALGTSG